LQACRWASRLQVGEQSVRTCARARHLGELHLAIISILLGSGERLFTDEVTLSGLELAECASSTNVAHLRFERA
jgi:dihydrofolate reductase